MKLYLLSIFLGLTIIDLQAQNNDPWTEYMMPAEVHKMLEKYTGEFEMEITMWMGADQSPQVDKVKSNNKMILGGRFLEMTQTGNMMGMDYNAITTLGFNNTDKSLGLVALTNMGTGMLALKGSWNDKERMATVSGNLTNPVTKNNISVIETVSFPDNNTILIVNYDKEGDESERKSIQYKFTRITK